MPNEKRKRLDLLLLELGLAPSRAQAQSLIAEGLVFLQQGDREMPLQKAGQLVDPKDAASLKVKRSVHPYVSRGGVKMAGALQHTGLQVANARVLDIGISTGGFSDCLLQNGAHSIVGVDVGHGQLATRLQQDARVTLYEGVNARELAVRPPWSNNLVFDLIVVDVSFISLELILPSALKWLQPQGSILALVKPQFEVGREGLGRGGIVKEVAQLERVQEKICNLCNKLSLQVEDYFESAIEGGDGNREFFVWARHADGLSKRS